MPVLLAPRPRVAEIDLTFPTFPAGLGSLRVAQLSDLHCGAFASERRVDSWVDQANELAPDLTVLTGDYVAWGPHYARPVTRALGRLRARLGVVACMGNHDYFGAGEALVRGFAEHGVPLLRNAARVVAPGFAVAAVDDRWSRRAHLGRALAGVPGGAFTLLLAHDPAQFPEIAAAGVPLTLSGHTHAGQLAVPGRPAWNFAALAMRYTHGIYREGASALYVNSGLGTTGPPIRVGTRAEIALLTLRA
jgi:uncharacterized protein